MNVEGMDPTFFNKKMELHTAHKPRWGCASDSILRNSFFVIRYSAVRCLIDLID